MVIDESVSKSFEDNILFLFIIKWVKGDLQRAFDFEFHNRYFSYYIVSAQIQKWKIENWMFDQII